MTPPPSSPSSSEAYSSHRVPWTLIIQVGGLALAIVVIFLLSSQYPVLNWIGDARKHIESLGIWSGIVYPIAYAICNVLLLPGGILSIGGGFIFGLWWGFLIVLVGNLLGATTAFCIARRLGRRRVEKLINNSRRLRVIDRAIERHGWKIVVLSQLNPLAPSSLTKLFLRADAGPALSMPSVDRARPNSRVIPLRVYRHVRPVRRRNGPRH